MKIITHTTLATLLLAATSSAAFAQNNDVNVDVNDDSANVSVQTNDQSSNIGISVPEDGIEIGVKDGGVNLEMGGINLGSLLGNVDLGGEDGGLDLGGPNGSIDFGGEDGALDLGLGGQDVNIDLGIVRVDNSGLGVNVPGVNINLATPITLGASFDADTLEDALETVNQPVNLNVLFDFNSDTLTAEGEAQVALIAEAIDGLRNRNVVEIQGHTDNVGGLEFNENLSFRRATTVRSRLKSEFNTRQKLVISGAGESQPVATNETDAGRQLNRRVTIINLGSP